MKREPHGEEVFVRFVSHLLIYSTERCIEWNLYCNPKGYGHFHIGGKTFYAHRVAAEFYLERRLRREEIAIHLCRNPRCCNPKHIAVGSISDNNRYDAIRFVPRKGRRSRLSISDILEIKLALRMDHPVWLIASRKNVSESTVRDIKNGASHRDVKLPTAEKLRSTAIGLSQLKKMEETWKTSLF